MDAFKSVIREFKVLRDIWQFSFIALYSVIDYLKDQVKVALSIIPNIITLNLPNEVYEIISGLIIALVLLVAICLVIVGYFIEPRMKLLLDSPSWVSISNGKKKTISAFLLIYTTGLQSVNNAVLSYMFFRKSPDSNSQQCSESPNGGLQFLAVLIVVFLDVFILVLLFRRIKRDKPVIKGKFRNYNNQKYSLDLETLQTPYKSLFEEYSYRMAYYEILVIIVKIFSIFLMIGVSLNNQSCSLTSSLTTREGSQAIMNANAFLLILEVFKFSFFHFSRPYLNLSSNRRMAFGCFMNTVMYFINLNVIWPTVDTTEGENLGVGLAINFWICNFFLGLIWLFTSESKIQGKSGVANIYKKLTKKLDMTPITLRNFDDKPTDVIDNYVLFNETLLDLDREKRLIFWQPWWDQFFEDYALRKPKKKKTSKCYECFGKIQDSQSSSFKLMTSSYDILYLPDCPPVFRPMIENKKIVKIDTSKPLHTLHERFVENSILLHFLDNDLYNKALIMNENKKKMIDTLISLVGTDIVYDGKFHQMSVIPFPFTVVMIEDGSPNYTKVIDIKQQDNLEKIIKENADENNKKKKEIRRKIRGLEGKIVNWPKKVRKRVFNFSMREFEHIDFNFEKARLEIKRDTNCYPVYGPHNFNIGSGFSCSLVYEKIYAKDSSGKLHGHAYTMPSSEFGLKPSLEMNNDLQDFFIKNKDLIVETYTKYKETLKIYRDNIRFVYFDDKTGCLSYEFTFKIYNDITLTKDALKELFLKEKNNDIQKIGQDMDNNPKITNLYGYMELMNKSMKQCWWVLFWYDLWILNKYFKGYAQPAKFKNTSKFNVFLPDNIAENFQQYENKKDLKRLLESEGKMKFFKKRKLFESIFVMIEKMEAQQLIHNKLNSMTEEERLLHESLIDDVSSPLSRQKSPSLFQSFSRKFKTKTKDFDENSSPKSRDLPTALSIKIQPAHQTSSENKTPTEGQRLLETDPTNNNNHNKETMSPLSPQEMNDLENLLRDQKDQILEVDEEEKKE